MSEIIVVRSFLSLFDRLRPRPSKVHVSLLIVLFQLCAILYAYTFRKQLRDVGQIA